MLTWDDLPGDTANHLADLGQKLDWIDNHLSDDTDANDYELLELRADMMDLAAIVQRARDAVATRR